MTALIPAVFTGHLKYHTYGLRTRRNRFAPILVARALVFGLPGYSLKREIGCPGNDFRRDPHCDASATKVKNSSTSGCTTPECEVEFFIIDTNVVVSAALTPEGLQRTTLVLALTKPALFYVSRPILEEYADVLSRQELGIRKGIRQQLLQLIKNHSHIVTPSRRLEVAGGPDDNIFLECADAARADYLITGNQKHFPRFWKKTKIITTREFIGLAAPHLIK